jgi:hypothetical protein
MCFAVAFLYFVRVRNRQGIFATNGAHLPPPKGSRIIAESWRNSWRILLGEARELGSVESGREW